MFKNLSVKNTVLLIFNFLQLHCFSFPEFSTKAVFREVNNVWYIIWSLKAASLRIFKSFSSGSIRFASIFCLINSQFVCCFTFH